VTASLEHTRLNWRYIDNPLSPYLDSGVDGGCWFYRLVSQDAIGHGQYPFAANLVDVRPRHGTAGEDYYVGTAAANSFNGGAGRDFIFGGGGNDRLTGGSGADVIDGGAGNDVIYANDHAGGDTVRCGSGRDTVYANDGDHVAADCERVVRVS
jgi:Ca2+-binding RTX toxin-like protein